MADYRFCADTIVLSGNVLTASGQTLYLNNAPLMSGGIFALDINLVRTTGDQGVSGLKTFSSVNITSGIFIAPNNFSTLNRTLSSTTGIVFDYQNGLFYNTGSLNTLDFYNRVLKSGNSILTLSPSLDWNKREIYGEWNASSPNNSSGIANKAYVDSLVSAGGVTGLSITGSSFFSGGFTLSGISPIFITISGQSIYFGTSSTGQTVDWADILNKPTGFTPVGHGHTTGQITGLENYLAKVDTGNFLDTTKITTINGGFGNTILTGNGIVSSGGQFFVFNKGGTSVTGGPLIINPNLLGINGFEVIQSGTSILFSGGAGSSTTINGLNGAIILTGSAVTTNGNTFIFSQGSGTSSGVRVTGGDYITDSNFVGIGTTIVTQSGNNILVSGASAAAFARSYISGTTISLTSGAFDSGFLLDLGKTSILQKIETSVPAWVRVYSNTGYQSGDFSRSILLDPSGEHGVMLEALTSFANLSLDLAPPPTCYSTNSVNNIYMTVQNRNTTDASIGVAITKLVLE